MLYYFTVHRTVCGCGGIGRHASLRSYGLTLTIRKQAVDVATSVKNGTQHLSMGTCGVEIERRIPVN